MLTDSNGNAVTDSDGNSEFSFSFSPVAETVRQASEFASDLVFTDLKSSYVDETGSFKPDAFEAVDPDTAKKLVMAELQQQVQDARDNAVLSKAMNNLLAAAASTPQPRTPQRRLQT